MFMIRSKSRAKENMEGSLGSSDLVVLFIIRGTSRAKENTDRWVSV
jgi:hypothetical protein